VLQAPVLPQGGFAAHAAKQQTPLLVLQTLFWHSAFMVHARPSGLSTQLPPWQVSGATQSPFTVQLVLHAPPAQAYGGHIVATVVDVVHVPLPLQVEGVNRFVPLHVGPEHGKPAACFWHAPAPLQSPVLPHSGCDVVGQSPVLPLEVFGKLAQVPKLPGTLHALQATTGVLLEGPQNAALQQTPSVQKPDKQSLFTEQPCPRRFWVPQVAPLAQRFGDRHWLSVEHTP